MQDLEAEGALACLAGRSGRYLIKRNAVLLGRSTGVLTCISVGLDLAPTCLLMEQVM
jgi:hypothetical protein